MTAAAALILYPSWAIAVLLAATAARLGRSTGRGLFVLCGFLTLWITTLILVEVPATRALAEHLVPFGMLQAGAWVHAGMSVTQQRSQLVWLGYGFGAAVGAIGALAPRLLYGPDMVGAGPAFWPIAIAAAAGSIWVIGWMATEARRRHGAARRQMILLSAAQLFGVAAGGGALLLRVVGVVHDLRLTAPALLASVLVIGGAVLRGEVGAARRTIERSIAYAVMAAAITAVGITALLVVLPTLAPGPGIAWTLAVVLIAALPLDAVRTLVVDSLGRRLFSAPIGVRDLTEQAEASEVKADHAARLAEIGALVGAVAHEVRNPLGVISAHAKVLERAGAPAASLAAIRAQVARASEFVDDLLAYGKPRPLAVSELALRTVVDDAVAAVAAVHPAAQLVVEVDPALRVVADRAALLDVLVNLIGNAAIAIGDRSRAVIAAAAEATAVAIAVTDDGPGVPLELTARLFQPFVTGRGRDHAHPGTGLGLAIARSIAERHGGTLHHEPSAQRGARFVLRLPRG